MKKTASLLSTSTLLLALLSTAAPAAAGEPAQPPPDVPDRSEAVSRADRAVEKHPAAVALSAQGQLHRDRVIVDDSGKTHVRYTRTYQGLPVLGGDTIVHNGPNGAFAGATKTVRHPISVSTEPAVGPGQAKQAARTRFQGDPRKVVRPQLVVDSRADEGQPRLAWDVVVKGMRSDGQTPSRLHVLVDARHGNVLGAWDEIKQAEPAQEPGGTGNSLYLGKVGIDTTPRSGGAGFIMRDPSHGEGTTCDMNNKRTGPCETFTDADNEWGNGEPTGNQTAAVDAHFGAAATFDYFKKEHGRAGIFGDGRGVLSRVHYGEEYINAFWNGTSMTYGDGRNGKNPLVALDVTGHEMSHGITQELAGLVYAGESGGLNESTSDIFGSMVEFYVDSPKDKPDYLIGDQIADNFPGTPALRSMVNPRAYGPDYFNCYDPDIGKTDVHYSSAVGNHFFFLLAEGSGESKYGTSPTCDGSGLRGIGHTKAADIWYHALNAYLTSAADYADAREATLQASSDLYGTCSVEYQTVQQAWSAVSVEGTDATCDSKRPKVLTATITKSCDVATRTCRFDAAGSDNPDGSIANYKWDFGDGETATGKTVSHGYDKLGPHTVTLTVTSTSGGTATTAVNALNYNAAPTAAFTASCHPGVLTCTFDGTASQDPDGELLPVAEWDLDDGTSRERPSLTLTHRFPHPGSYTVTLTVTDNEGKTDTTKKTVTVG